MMQMKMLAAAALAGALLSSTAVPSQAAHGRHAAAAIGFGVGALAGAAMASAATQPYYGSAYYVDGPYAYEPGYAYEPNYVYAPAPVYVEPAPAYVYTQPAPVYSAPPAYVARPAPTYAQQPLAVNAYAAAPAGQCWVSTDSSRGFGYYGACKSGQTDLEKEKLGARGSHNKSVIKP